MSGDEQTKLVVRLEQEITDTFAVLSDGNKARKPGQPVVPVAGENKGEIAQKREVNPASLANLRPFPPGRTGNASGRPRTKLIRRRMLRQLLAKDGDVQAVDKMVSNILSAASGGAKDRVPAFVAIRDSVDGRPESSDNVVGAAIQVNVSYGAVPELEAAFTAVVNDEPAK